MEPQQNLFYNGTTLSPIYFAYSGTDVEGSACEKESEARDAAAYTDYSTSSSNLRRQLNYFFWHFHWWWRIDVHQVNKALFRAVKLP